ncbi:MAG: hypothetical protein CML68_09880 [Rhodobacteraceae bacterium]|nr:hypothetical protein [Paracoccaceae bacterium]
MTDRRQDIVLGGVFAAIGISAAVIAAGYPGASGVYPMALGCVVAALGLLVLGRAVLSGPGKPRILIDHGPRVAITLGTAAAYLGLVPVLGFYLASALLVVLLPPALGFRRPVFVLVNAAVFVGIVWLVFSIVLEKPLPTPFWSAY